MALGIVAVLVVLLGLLMAGMLVGGLWLNRRHRREDEGRARDRINGP
ncbi:hypothetical protein [Egicoccus sp. AB-alg6-2]